jgi:hypothetical protein
MDGRSYRERVLQQEEVPQLPKCRLFGGENTFDCTDREE